MSLQNEHTCPICGHEHIPIWRALCRECFGEVPWRIRSDFLHAYRRRVSNPVRFQEVLIEVRQWFRDRKPASRKAEE